MDSDATMQFQTNLGRAEIEARLAQLRALATSSDLAEVAALLTGIEGQPREEMERRIFTAMNLLGGQDDYAYLIDQLDMLAMNLRNV